MNVYGIYFSPTGTSKKNINSIVQGIHEKYYEIDITLPNISSKRTFTSEDLVIFGGPVYAGRLCQEHVSRLQMFQGNGAPCVITVTYGNRDFDDALIEMFDVVSSLGFIPIAAGALIAKHTYGKIQEHRPDKKDDTSNFAFGNKVKEKVAKQDYSVVQVPGNRPYKEAMGKGHFIPTTKHELCTACKLCAKLCPMQAISYDDFTKEEDKICISCFRCIQVCCKHAKVMEGKEYQEFADMLTKKLADPKENLYYI